MNRAKSHRFDFDCFVFLGSGPSHRTERWAGVRHLFDESKTDLGESLRCNQSTLTSSITRYGARGVDDPLAQRVTGVTTGV